MKTLRQMRTQFSNGLGEDEAERLAWLIEECGEIVQIGCKILRHGYGSRNPEELDGVTNREMLERELGDLTAAVRVMRERGDVKLDEIQGACERKLVGVWRWMHHNVAGGLK